MKNLEGLSPSQIVSIGLQQFPKKYKLRLTLTSVFAATLNLIDLFLTLFLGLVIANIVGLSASNGSNSKFAWLNSFSKEFTSDSKKLLAFLITYFLLVLIKNWLQLYFLKKTLVRFSHYAISESTNLFRKIISGGASSNLKLSKQNIIYALTNGGYALYVSFPSYIMMLISDLLILIAFSIAFLAIDSALAIFILIILMTIFKVSNLVIGKKALRSGELSAKANIDSNNFVSSSIDLTRNIFTRNKEYDFAKKFELIRIKGISAMLDSQLAQQIPRVIMELSVLLFISSYIVYTIFYPGGSNSLASLIVVSTMLSRFAPILIRIQSNWSNLKLCVGPIRESLQIITTVNNANLRSKSIKSNSDLSEHLQLKKPSKLEIKNLNFSFSNISGDLEIFRDFSLEVNPGDFVAIIGPSGSGKSTLIDLIIGLREPQGGTIRIDEMSPIDFITDDSKSLDILPQESILFEGTLFENITLTDQNRDSELYVWEALELAQLDDFVQRDSLGLNMQIEENGKNLSGGQKQRIALARVFFRKPSLLILDEPTSALDAEKVSQINAVLNQLKGKTTIICVAHTEQTIFGATKIVKLPSKFND